MTIRARILPRLPARVIPGPGIDASVSHGNLEASLEYRGLIELPPDVADLLAVQDPESGAFKAVPLGSLPVSDDVQDALDLKADKAIEIATENSLTGGGDLSANRTLSLVGDTASPGNLKLYGTDSSGNRGWYDIPSDQSPSFATRTALKANAITGPGRMAVLAEGKRSGLFVWRAGNYSTHVSTDTQEGIYLKADAVSSSVGVWERVLNGPLAPEMFGAANDWDGTTGTADTSAINGMISVAKMISAEMEIRPGGGYRCTSSITATDMKFVLRGPSLRNGGLVFDVAGHGLLVSQSNYTFPTHIEDVTCLTNRQEAGNAIRVTYSATDSITNRAVPRCNIIRPWCAGVDPNAHGWGTGVYIQDVHNALIERPVITGRKDNSASGRNQFNKMVSGIRIVGSGSMTAIPSDIRIVNPHVYHSQYGVRGTGEMEGVLVFDPILVAVGTGVAIDNDSLRPWVQIKDGHVSAFDFGVRLSNCPQPNITDLLIYKGSDPNPTGHTQGIKLTNCNEAQISNIRAINMAGDVAVYGKLDGIALEHCVGATVDNIVAFGADNIVIISGTSGNCTIGITKSTGTVANSTPADVTDISSGGGNVVHGKYASTSNGSSGTATSSAVTFCSLSMPRDVLTGEVYEIESQVSFMGKGATAGDCYASVTKSSGTASVVFSHNKSNLADRRYTQVGGDAICNVAGSMRVTASGTLTLKTEAISLNSDASIVANAANLTVRKV